MNDLEKLFAKTDKVLCVEEIITKRTYYNRFGDKVDEDTHTTSTFYTFKQDTENIKDIGWIKGQE